MPELPEVETTCRALEGVLVGRRIKSFAATVDRLRLPLDLAGMTEHLAGRKIKALRRRAKYLVLETTGKQALVIHLGMSGSLSWLPGKTEPPGKHVRFRLLFTGGWELRLRDPRRFGAVVRCPLPVAGGEPEMLAGLGPEPLEDDFSVDYIHARSRGRRTPVKTFIMDQRVVVGVGNIYASEALFRAGIRPTRQVGRTSRPAWSRIIKEIREVLAESIAAGGTTLADFISADGGHGDFIYQLRVYGRVGESCGVAGCKGVIRRIVQGGRSTFYCPVCQV